MHDAERGDNNAPEASLGVLQAPGGGNDRGAAQPVVHWRPQAHAGGGIVAVEAEIGPVDHGHAWFRRGARRGDGNAPRIDQGQARQNRAFAAAAAQHVVHHALHRRIGEGEAFELIGQGIEQQVHFGDAARGLGGEGATEVRELGAVIVDGLTARRQDRP